MRKRMNRALKGLKDTYPNPDPIREKEFIDSLPLPEPKNAVMPLLHIGGKPIWYVIPATAVAAVMLIAGIGLYKHVGQHDLPTIMEPTETDAVSTEAVSETEAENVAVTEEMAEPTQNSGISPSADPTEGDDQQGSTPLVTEPVSQQTTVPRSESPTVRPIDFITEPSEQPSTVQSNTEQPDKSLPTESEEPTEGFAESPMEPAEPIDPTEGDQEKPVVDPIIPAQRDDRVTPYYDYRLMESDQILYAEMPDFEETKDDLVTNSDVIVLAQVRNVWYTRNNYEALTQLDLEVLGVYKGYYSVNDLLSVYETGGYLPVREYLRMYPEESERYPDTNATIAFPGLLTREDSIYVFFLRRAYGSGIPSGAYVYTARDSMSRCMLENGVLQDADGNIVMSEKALREAEY